MVDSRRSVWNAMIVAAVAAAFGTPASAGLWRTDRVEQVSIDLGADPKYASVCAVSLASGDLGSGVLMGSRYVLTSAFLVPTTATGTIAVGGVNYNIASVVHHPSWIANPYLGTGNDYALVRLGAAVPLSGAGAVVPASRLYKDTDLGSTTTMVGFGSGGTGTAGITSPAFGTKRAGTNTIDAIGTAVFPDSNANVALLDFDSPTDITKSTLGVNTATVNEFCILTGDGGGGAFVDVANGSTSRARLAGINSFAYNPFTFGQPTGQYGTALGIGRVNRYNQWIDDNTSQNWWLAGNGTFSSAIQWNNFTAPGSESILQFNSGNAATYTISFTANATVEKLTVRSGTLTFALGGRTLTTRSPVSEGDLVIGKFNDGTSNNANVTFSGGFVVANTVSVAMLAGSVGTLTLSGAQLSAGTGVFVGGDDIQAGGTGALVVNDACVVTSPLVRAWQPGLVRLNAGGSVAGLVELAGGRVWATGTASASGLSSIGGTIETAGRLNVSQTFATTGTTTKIGVDSLTLGATVTSIDLAGIFNINAGGVTLARTAGGTTKVTGLAAAMMINVASGASLTLAGPGNTLTDSVTGQAADVAVNGSLSVTGGTQGAARVTGTGAVNVGAGATLQATSVRGPGVVVGGTLRIADSAGGIVGFVSGTSVVSSLAIAKSGSNWTGFLDIRNNDVIVRNAPVTLDDDLRSAARQYMLTSLGGLGSTRSDGLFVGFAENRAIGYTTFSGQSVTTNDLLIKYTWQGDFNLDGRADGDDYLLWLQNFNNVGVSWVEGDADYDGTINGDDYLLWLQNFGNGVGAPLAAVPEPGVLGLMAVGAMAMLRRRR